MAAVMRSRASSHVARRHGDRRVARIIGCSRRRELSRISGEAWPRTHRNPRLSGLSGSPLTRTTRSSTTSTSIPHSVGWQFIGHIVRITWRKAVHDIPLSAVCRVGGTRRAPHDNVQRMSYRLSAAALCLTLSACTLSRPHYATPDIAVGQPTFVRTLEAHADAELVRGNRAQVLLNGDEIFPAMLEAIRGATSTITFANFIYEKGDVARDMAEALAERCRAGVGGNVLLDAVGSKSMPKKYRQLMERSGCHVASYHSLNPLAIKRVNHRNHRRVLVVDGRLGFTGGTGVGEKWTGDGRREGHWRQTDVRVAASQVYEYGPALLHAKTMVVDGRWVSIGSANLDNRSFALNSELNLAFLDRGLADRMTAVFREDLGFTKPVRYDDWRRHRVRNVFYLPLIPLRDQL